MTIGDVLNFKNKKGKSEKKLVQWLGKTQCDGCKRNCDVDGILYDAKSKFGPWGVFCSDCFPKYTFGNLGTGWGQKYILDNETNKFIKVEG